MGLTHTFNLKTGSLVCSIIMESADNAKFTWMSQPGICVIEVKRTTGGGDSIIRYADHRIVKAPYPYKSKEWNAQIFKEYMLSGLLIEATNLYYKSLSPSECFIPTKRYYAENPNAPSFLMRLINKTNTDPWDPSHIGYGSIRGIESFINPQEVSICKGIEIMPKMLSSIDRCYFSGGPTTLCTPVYKRNTNVDAMTFFPSDFYIDENSIKNYWLDPNLATPNSPFEYFMFNAAG
jgi:hypothetical protein